MKLADLYQALRVAAQSVGLSEWENPLSFDTLPNTVANFSYRIEPGFGTAEMSMGGAETVVRGTQVMTVRFDMTEFTAPDKVKTRVLATLIALLAALLAVEAVEGVTFNSLQGEDHRHLDVSFNVSYETCG